MLSFFFVSTASGGPKGLTHNYKADLKPTSWQFSRVHVRGFRGQIKAPVIAGYPNINQQQQSNLHMQNLPILPPKIVFRLVRKKVLSWGHL